MKNSELKFETKTVRSSIGVKHKNAPLVSPIYQTATFEVADIEQQRIAPKGDMFYTRYGNPTLTCVQNAIADLENAEAALLFSSGMAAITTAIFSVVKAGDHIVCQKDIYGGTSKFLNQWLLKFAVETTFVETTDINAHARAIRPNTKLIYLESPTNPTLKIVDLESIVKIAKQHKVLTFIDNTLSSPFNLRPIEYGIDIVLHSGTKYLSGHTDVICGVAVGKKDLITEIYKLQNELGGSLDPHAAWLLHRGLKTLALRVERQNENALRLATYLSQHSSVKHVYYPFLPTHPQFKLAKKQMKGGGGLLSCELNVNNEKAKQIVEALRLFSIAPSLGGIESLVTIPALTSHAMISEEKRKEMGITDQLVRIAVGIENIDDLISDWERALST